MRPRLTVACVLVALLLPSIAAAREVSGKWGLGYETTLTALGVSGLSGAYAPLMASGLAGRVYIGNLGLEGVLGAAFRSVPEGTSETRTFLSVGAIWNVFRSPTTNLGLGLRGVFGMVRNPLTGQLDSRGKPQQNRGTIVGLTFEVPLRAEYFLSDNFAFAAAVGPVVEFSRSDANPLTGNSAFGVDLFRGGFSGGLGFTVYFR